MHVASVILQRAHLAAAKKELRDTCDYPQSGPRMPMLALLGAACSSILIVASPSEASIFALKVGLKPTLTLTPLGTCKGA